MIKTIEYVDVGKTRRRIEDYLRKHTSEVDITKIANLLGVEVAKISLPEVSGKEIRQAESFEEQLKDFPKTKSPFPQKFAVYYAYRCRRSFNGVSPGRIGPNCFTKVAAERFCRLQEDTVAAHPLDIIDMRAKIRETNPEDLFPEEREMFKRLKQLLFPAK